MTQRPNSGSASRGNQFLAPNAPPPVIATNFKPINKGAVVGSVDLFVVRWRFWIYGALWMRQHDREWISLPSQEWTNDAGEKKYFPIVKFENHSDQRRFSQAAIEAIRKLTAPAGQSTKTSPRSTTRSAHPSSAPPSVRSSSKTGTTPLASDPVDDLWPEGAP